MAQQLTIANLITWAGESARINANRPRRDVQIVSVSEVMQEGYETRVDNKVIVCQLIQMKHYSQSKSYTVTGGGRNYATSGYGNNNQRQRLTNQRDHVPYDRLCMFADLSERDSGKCFVICFTHVTAGAKFFTNMPSRVNPGVGSIFVIEEPRQVRSYLGSNDSVPIIDKWNRIVPMGVSVTRCVPIVRMNRGKNGITNYFCYKGITALTLSSIAIIEACCNGFFCDRQVAASNEGMKCGCFHIQNEYKKGTGKVLEVSVTFPAPVNVDERGFCIAHDFRSHRFGNLFLEKAAWEVYEVENVNHQRRLRQCVENVCEYFRNNGGFTYVGWKRVGLTQDVSDEKNTNVASDTQVPHICYLYPTREDLVTTTNNAYRSLLLTRQRLNEPEDDENDDNGEDDDDEQEGNEGGGEEDEQGGKEEDEE